MIWVIVTGDGNIARGARYFKTRAQAEDTLKEWRQVDRKRYAKYRVVTLKEA